MGEYKIIDYKFAPNNADVAIIYLEKNKDGQHAGEVVKPAKIVNKQEITSEWVGKNKNTLFSSAGYPSDRDDSAMWYSQGSILNFVSFPYSQATNVELNLKSHRGSSGSPLFDKDNNVVGIVHSITPDTKHTFAQLFREDVYTFLQENLSNLKNK